MQFHRHNWHVLLTTVLATICSVASLHAQIADGGEYYIRNDFYDKVLGLNADGTLPRLSAFGTNENGESYVFVAEASNSEGYYLLRNKATGKYLCASTSNTWSLVFADKKGSGDEYLWNLDVQFGRKIMNKKNTGARLGCDWSTDDYVAAYYDKAASSRGRWSVFAATEGGYEKSLAAAQTDVFTNSIGREERDIYQLTEALTLSDELDLHLVSPTLPIDPETGSINITNRNAWVIFDDVRPSEVLEKYLACIKINGREAKNGSNVRVAIYLDGAAVIPSTVTNNVFSGYTGEGYTGESLNLRAQNYKSLSRWNNRIRGFILKRGYMATLYADQDGGGYSRVYVADHADLLVPVLPDALNQRISSIHIKPWQYTSKKGWCSTQSNSGIASGAAKMEASWFYTWSADRQSTSDCEYVPIKQHIYWPSWSQINALESSTHVLGYNEPEHSEQHDNCDCGGVISSWKATTCTPDFAPMGMRVGSGAPTDASWLTEYIGHVDDMAYRCDFVAIHSYWGPNEANGASAWYNRLKSIYDNTGRPIWITEWAYGASWTTESWPSNYGDQLEKNRAAIMDIVDMLERTPFIERYSYYQWDTSSRRFINDDGWVTPAGEVYAKTKSTFAYNAAYQKVPNWWKPSLKAPTLSYALDETGENIVFTLGNTNGDLTETLTLEKRNRETGEWESLYEISDRYLFDYDQDSENETIRKAFRYEMPASEVDRFNDRFRVTATRTSGDTASSATIDFGFIKNPECANGTNEWSVSTLSTNKGEAYDGDATNVYWDQWKANGLSSSMQQTTEALPEGDYVLSALLRASSNVSVTLSATVITADGEGVTESATITGKGSTTIEGADYLNGWEKVALPAISINDGERLLIKATATGSGSAWWSADDFMLDYTPGPSVGIAKTTDGRPQAAETDVYDMQGRRIAQPQLRGIFIQNGKKKLYQP